MLILGTESGGFRDSDDPAVRYRLPVALEPAVSGDDVPQAMLATHADGGLLILTLRPRWPELGTTGRRVTVSAARFRILLRGPDSTDAGQWHDSRNVAAALVDRRVTLNALEASLARRLAQSADELLEIEVEYALQGLSPVYPWRVVAETAQLKAQVEPRLPGPAASWGQIESVFQGLRREDFQWYPGDPDALPPPADAAFALFAAHARPHLFTRSDAGWTLREDAPERLTVDLSLPRPLTRWFGLRWSFSQFLATQADPRRHLFELSTPAPFEAADLLLTHDLSLSDDGIRNIDVEIRTGGPDGELNHRFEPGQPSVARMHFVRETFNELSLQAKLKATVMTPRGPGILRGELRNAGLTLHITAETFRIKPVSVSATPEVFDRVTAIEVELGSRRLVLTRDAALRWAIRRSPATPAATTAVLESGERIALGEVAPTDGNIVITAETLGVGAIDDIVFDLADTDGRIVYLAVRTENGPWRTLEPGPQRYGRIRLADRLRPVSLRYQTRHVERDAGGATKPMVESDWREAVGTTVSLPA